MKMKFWEKKRDLKEILIIQIGEDEAELAECKDKDRKKELRANIDRKLEALAKLEQSKKEGIAKVIVGVLTVIGAVAPVAITVTNYNTQYKRDRDALDEVQMGMGRSRFSPANQVKRP